MYSRLAKICLARLLRKLVSLGVSFGILNVVFRCRPMGAALLLNDPQTIIQVKHVLGLGARII